MNKSEMIASMKKEIKYYQKNIKYYMGCYSVQHNLEIFKHVIQEEWFKDYEFASLFLASGHITILGLRQFPLLNKEALKEYYSLELYRKYNFEECYIDVVGNFPEVAFLTEANRIFILPKEELKPLVNLKSVKAIRTDCFVGMPSLTSGTIVTNLVSDYEAYFRDKPQIKVKNFWYE